MNEGTRTADILLIDDDRQLADMLVDFLAVDRLALSVCTSGEDGLRVLAERRFDLVILDIMLPGLDGLDVLKRLRRDSDIHVIMLTARGDDIDRIIGLEFGADDYLAKPFNPRELVARIKAILRRAARGKNEASELATGGITLDLRTRQARVAATRGLTACTSSPNGAKRRRCTVTRMRSPAPSNVLRNAVRHSPPGGTVLATVTTDGDGGALIEVDDQGPGVGEDELPRLFEPCFRTRRSTEDASRPGTGLSLAIARRAVQRNGGTIQAANRETGGLRVVISLPAA